MRKYHDQFLKFVEGNEENIIKILEKKPNFITSIVNESIEKW